MDQRSKLSLASRLLLGDERGLPIGRFLALTLLLIAAIASAVAVVGEPPAPSRLDAPMPSVEFARLVREFSEPGGFFRSDNFVSNETSYLHIVDLLKEYEVTGGAYIGVGPEQNFTYIAKVRPRLAFIVDVRRQAMLQHLMYKAIFHLANSRRDFLSLLLSRPVDPAGAPVGRAPLEELVKYFRSRSADVNFFEETFRKLVRYIQRDCHLPLSPEDVGGIHYVFSAFRDNGLDIRYRIGRGGDSSVGYTGYWDGAFPNLEEVSLETDLNGKLGSFLASDEDFFFVKEMHRRNRILPIVGDFAGPKALRTVGNYLKKNRLTVSAFYVSNVEQYLYQYNIFPAFAENVKTLPIDDRSIFIRSVAGRRMQHPANVPRHRLTTILQKMTKFVEVYNEGELLTYWDLVTTNYLAATPQAVAKK